MVGTTAMLSTLLTVVGRAVEADIGRERRFQARLALLAFEAFEQCCLLAADIGAGAMVDVDVEVPPVRLLLLTNEAGLIGLVNASLQTARARE